MEPPKNNLISAQAALKKNAVKKIFKAQQPGPSGSYPSGQLDPNGNPYYSPGMAQQQNARSFNEVSIRVRVTPQTALRLGAIGQNDLEQYFIRKALDLEPGDQVDVAFRDTGGSPLSKAQAIRQTYNTSSF